MATHPSVDANVKADTERAPEGRAPVTYQKSGMLAQIHCAEDILFQATPDAPPIAVIPQALAHPPNKRRNLRRIITREEGRALEMIGHAMDYLNDCYLYEGDDTEFFSVGVPIMQALGILTSARAEILQSLPLKESIPIRFWNTLFHRSSCPMHDNKSRAVGMIP